MANLLETLQKNSQLQKQGVTDETNKLSSLLRARSGKQLSGGTVAQSNLGEQAAVAETNAIMQQQVAPQASIQQAGLQQQQSEIAQQEQQQRAEISQRRNFNNLETQLRTEQTLKELERNKGQVDTARQGAQMEQVAANLRLQNKKYIDNLQREGNKARLNDALSFREAALRSSLGNNMELLNKSIDSNTLLNANEREFRKQVAKIDIATAYQMFNNDMKAARNNALWTGGAAIAKAGIGAYGTFSGSATGPKTAAEIDADSGGMAANNITKDYSNVG